MLELELIMMGLPKREINEMTASEIQVVRHLMSHMMRAKNGE